MGRCTSRRRYSLVNFKRPIGRSHWPSYWHGSYGIIYNPPQSPQPSVDSYCVINTNDIYLLLWSSTENLKTTSWVILRLEGYDDMTQQVLPVSANSSAPGCWRETRSRRLLLYWWKFKGRQKYSGSQWCFRFIVRFNGNPISHTALKPLVSGSNLV